VVKGGEGLKQTAMGAYGRCMKKKSKGEAIRVTQDEKGRL